MSAPTEAPPSEPRRGRVYGLDALRGLAVFLMIEQHMGVWLWHVPPGHGRMDFWWLVGFNALGGGAAPMFVTLAGMGCSLLAAKTLAKGGTPDLTLVRRGIALMGFGYLLSFLTPSWFTWRSWFVLHLMGFGMTITPLLRRLSTRNLLALGLLIVAFTPLVQHALGTPDLNNRRMAGFVGRAPGTEVIPYAPLRIAVAEGQFPIFPWLSFFVAGLAVGRWLDQDRLGHVTRLAGAVIVAGGVLAGIWALGISEPGTLLYRATRIRVPFFPASPPLALLLLGAVLLAIRGVLAWEQRRPLNARSMPVTLGRASLTLLLVHVVVFRELSRPIGWWNGLTAWAALGVILAFLALSVLLSQLWQRAGYRFGAEWVLRKAGGG